MWVWELGHRTSMSSRGPWSNNVIGASMGGPGIGRPCVSAPVATGSGVGPEGSVAASWLHHVSVSRQLMNWVEGGVAAMNCLFLVWASGRVLPRPRRSGFILKHWTRRVRASSHSGQLRENACPQRVSHCGFGVFRKASWGVLTLSTVLGLGLGRIGVGSGRIPYVSAGAQC